MGQQVLDTSVRNNDRCIHDDPELAQELFRRIQPHVAHLTDKCETRDGQMRTMVPREFNERLRVLKYTSEPGNPNYFKAHFDGTYPRPRNHPKAGDFSKYTVLIYLNGGFEGGATRLYKNAGWHTDLKKAVKKGEYDDCVPSAGRIMIHDHGIFHEGMPVEEGTGTKYVIRTDIMLTEKPNDATDIMLTETPNEANTEPRTAERVPPKKSWKACFGFLNSL
jgi:hypothetical protein